MVSMTCTVGGKTSEVIAFYWLVEATHAFIRLVCFVQERKTWWLRRESPSPLVLQTRKYQLQFMDILFFPPSHTREGSETSPGCLILAFGSAEKSTWWKMRRRIERDTVNLLSHVMTRGLGREREVERSCGVAETWTTRTSLWARKVQRL